MPSINQAQLITKHIGLPVWSLILAATLWGIFWYPLRLFNDQGLSGLWASLFMYIGTLAVGGPWLVKYRHAFVRSPLLLLGIALTSGWTNIAFTLAVIEGPVLRAILLFYLSPVWATLMAWLFLKESHGLRVWLVLAIAMTGAIIMLWEAHLGYPWPQSGADVLALSAGIAFAMVNILTRYTGFIPLQAKTTAAWLGGIGVAGVVIVAIQVPLQVLDNTIISYAVLYGAIGMVLMTITVQYGVTRLPVHRSSVILLFEVVVGAISAYLLANEILYLREWLGGALVLIAGYLSIPTEKDKSC